jgi:hypothetical protein
MENTMKIRIAIIAILCAIGFLCERWEFAWAKGAGNAIGMTSAGGNKGFGVEWGPGKSPGTGSGEKKPKKLPGKMKSGQITR